MQNADESRVFYLPVVYLFTASVVVLMAYVVWVSMHSISLMKPDGTTFIWLDNYIRFARDERALSALARTGLFTLVATVIEVVLGFLIALFLDRVFLGKRIVRALLLIPIIMTPVVIGLTWRILFNAQAGMINYWLSLIGFTAPIDWLGNPDLAIWVVMIVDIWQWTPFVVLLVLASLESMSTEPMDAARVDGAREWQVIRYVLLPLISRSLFVVGLIRAIDSVKAFDLFYIMTKGGPALSTETLNYYGYISAFTNFDISYSMTIALILTIFTNVAFLLVYGFLFPSARSNAS